MRVHTIVSLRASDTSEWRKATAAHHCLRVLRIQLKEMGLSAHAPTMGRTSLHAESKCSVTMISPSPFFSFTFSRATMAFAKSEGALPLALASSPIASRHRPLLQPCVCSALSRAPRRFGCVHSHSLKWLARLSRPFLPALACSCFGENRGTLENELLGVTAALQHGFDKPCCLRHGSEFRNSAGGKQARGKLTRKWTPHARGIRTRIPPIDFFLTFFCQDEFQPPDLKLGTLPFPAFFTEKY